MRKTITMIAIAIALLAPVLALLALCAADVSALDWSEILFNPLGNDENHEFVELIGNESLVGCTIHDAATGSRLYWHHDGADDGENGTILIMENDSVMLRPDYRSYADVMNTTVYTTKGSIGNGLGNSYETLEIVCNKTTIIGTSYNVSLLDGFAEGRSILDENGTWRVGIVNGTPGTRGHDTEPTTGSDGATTDGTATSAAKGKGGSGVSGIIACNTSMSILLSKNKGYPGDNVSFTIFAESYASYEATVESGTNLTAASDDGSGIITAGDTLDAKTHTLTLPQEGSVKLVAYAQECGSRTRMTKYITVLRRSPQEGQNDILPPSNDTTTPADRQHPSGNATDDAAAAGVPSPSSQQDSSEENASAQMTLAAAQPRGGDAPGSFPSALNPDATAAAGDAVAKRTIIDNDTNIVPWVCLFGAVTLIVSAYIFVRMRNDDG